MRSAIIFVIVSVVFTSCDEKVESSDSCGNSVVDWGEECDWRNLGGQFHQSVGYYGGRLEKRQQNYTRLLNCF